MRPCMPFVYAIHHRYSQSVYIWWLAMSTSLSGKLHRRPPSTVLTICPPIDLSPLILMTVGAQSCVRVVVSKPKDCLVNAIQALYQSLLIRYSGAPRNCAACTTATPDRK